MNSNYYYYYNRYAAHWTLSGTTRVNRYQKGKTNVDLLEQEIVSGSGIRWAIRKSVSLLRQITTMPESHHSVQIYATLSTNNLTKRTYVSDTK